MLLETRNNYFNFEELDDKAGKDRNRYQYNVFGLHIVSQILLPALLTATDLSAKPEVYIQFGKVPAGIVDAIEGRMNYQAAKNQFLLQVPGVGRYYVKDGKFILIEPDEQSEARFVRTFLLGTVFGVLLMQRGVLPIHGSAVVINGRGVIFTGISGAGKSTLLAAFRERGYSYLTDDVAAVTLDAFGAAWVHASYPQQKLWRDSAEATGMDITSSKPIVMRNGEDKFTIPAHKGFWPSSVPLAAVYELKTEKCQSVTIRTFSGVDKLAVLINNTYRLELIDGLGLKTAHFKHFAAVASQIAISRLIRPDGVFPLEEQIRLVEEDFTRILPVRGISF